MHVHETVQHYTAHTRSRSMLRHTICVQRRSQSNAKWFTRPITINACLIIRNWTMRYRKCSDSHIVLLHADRLFVMHDTWTTAAAAPCVNIAVCCCWCFFCFCYSSFVVVVVLSLCVAGGTNKWIVYDSNERMPIDFFHRRRRQITQ